MICINLLSVELATKLKRARKLAYCSAWMHENRERRKAYIAVWNKENIEKVREYGRNWAAKDATEENSKNAAWRKRNPEKVKKCSRDWSKANRDSCNAVQRKYTKRHKDKCLARCAAYRKKNLEKIKIQMREYRKKNRLKINDRQRARLLTDINFKLSMLLRKRLWSAIRYQLKAGSAVRDLGCSIPELKTYLEAKFKPGMTWANRGHKTWHIDHIRPLASFNLEDRVEFLKACHFTNLQPLWATENHIKSDKWEEPSK